MAVLRDIFRRKFRALLTIVGVSVGVLALVVLGAYVEKSNGTIDNIGAVLEGKVIVVDKNDSGVMGMGGDNPLSAETLAKLRAMPGVVGVGEGLAMLLDENAPITGVPAMIMGLGAVEDSALAKAFGFTPAQGRSFRVGERKAAVVGSDLVRKLGAEVGGTVTLRGREFKVVGIAKRSHIQLNDQSVAVPLQDVQEMYFEALPEAFRSRVKPRELVIQAYVAAEEGADANELAKRIEREVPGVLATGPDELQGQVDQLVSLGRLAVLAVATVALLVGALSVVNTMLVAVVERTHELGVKRALGATGARIARDVLTESAVMGLLGGLLGLAAGAAMTGVLNAAMYEASQNSSFWLTPRLAAGTIAFAVVLGLIGGLYPARYGARLDPIDALGHE